MPLHRETIHAFRLGHAAESFNVWDDNLPLSRQRAYSSVKDTASLLTLEIPEYKESSTDFINELSRRLNYYRPDLMDAFMMGRGAARLVILLAETDNNEDWVALLKNTKQGIAHGAGRLGIATGALEKWICDLEKLIHDVRNNSAGSTLIMAHINRLKNLVGQTQSGSIVMQVEEAHMQIFHGIKDSYVINESLVVGSLNKIKEEARRTLSSDRVFQALTRVWEEYLSVRRIFDSRQGFGPRKWTDEQKIGIENGPLLRFNYEIERAHPHAKDGPL